MFKLSKGYPLPAFTLLTLLVAGGYSVHNQSDDRYHHITYCISGEATESECKDVQHFDIDKAAVSFIPSSDYFIPSGSQARIFNVYFDPTSGTRELLYPSTSRQAQIHFQITSESVAEEFERSRAIYGMVGKPMNEEVGSLIMVSLWEHDGLGTEILTPKDSDRSLYMRCAKPFRAYAGNIVTNVGCSVVAQVLPHLVLHYTIRRSDTQNWRSIHEKVMNQFLLVVKERPTDMTYANANQGSRQATY